MNSTTDTQTPLFPDTTLPDRLKVLDWGTNQRGPVTAGLGNESVQNFDAIQAGLGLTRVPIDYENNTVEGSDAYKNGVEPRPVAGYGEPAIYPGDGLYLENIQWNPSGQANARNYAALKPALAINKANRNVIAVHSVGLSRVGGIHEIGVNSNLASAAAPAAAFSARNSRTYVPHMGGALRPTVAQLRSLGKAIGLQFAIAAHREETYGHPDYRDDAPQLRPHSAQSAATRFPGLKGLDLTIAINNAEHAGEFGYRQP